MNRVVDAMIPGVLLALTLPLIVVVAIAIRMDSPGPVFDAELCIGRSGRRFRMLQFRTTVYATSQPKPAWRRPQLTTVGAFLRYTRIDSLPQLFNVLLGDMSFVEWREAGGPFLE